MIYATLEDIRLRCRRQLGESEEKSCIALLEDAEAVVDTYNLNARPEAKKVVVCNMVLRAIGDGETAQVPIGTTQGTVSGLGYSQTWTMGQGSTGELYLTKLDKKLLGAGNRLGFLGPFCGVEDDA